MLVVFRHEIHSPALPGDPLELKEIIVKLKDHYEKEIDLLREQVRLLYARIFGKKAGRVAAAGIQLPLFDMPEPEVDEAKEEVVVPARSIE